MKNWVTTILVMLAAAAFAADANFPGFHSTDRAAIEAAAKSGDKTTRVMARVRLVQIDNPQEVDTYEKQVKVIEAFCAEEGLKDESLKYTIPLSTPDGNKIWPIEGWHAAHEADDYREMWYLVNTVQSIRNARAELGDAGLFERYSMLLKKNFSQYTWPVVHTAVEVMKNLVPAVDPIRAANELTHIRSRVELVAEKDPAKWNKTLKLIDAILDDLKKRN